MLFFVNNSNYPNKATKFKKLLNNDISLKFLKKSILTDFITISLAIPFLDRRKNTYNFSNIQYWLLALINLFLKNKHDIHVPLVEQPQNECKRNFVRGGEAKIMMILKARTIWSARVQFSRSCSLSPHSAATRLLPRSTLASLTFTHVFQCWSIQSRTGIIFYWKY